MALFGIDTSGYASDALKTQAAPFIGEPKFWGRYFNGTTANRNFQYNNSENAYLNQAGIPVLCFARQMWAVGEVENAAAHAKANMQGVIDAFGAQYLLNQKLTPILYLDVEPETGKPGNVMSQQYYETWSATIVGGLPAGGATIRFRPAVYLNKGDDRQSWLNLNAACAGGSVCVGISVARYIHQAGGDPDTVPPPASANMLWDDSQVTPEPNPIPPGNASANIPLLVWQYYGDYPKRKLPNGKIADGDVDFEMVNPAHEATVQSGLVLPPAANVG